MLQEAARMRHFSGAIFYELAEIARQRRENGQLVMDLGIGSPDMQPPELLTNALKQQLDRSGIFGYQRTEGTNQFKSAIADFLHSRYQVQVNAESEVLVTIGAQDALAHLALAFIDPGDVVLLPDPGYPIYEISVHLAGGVPYALPLREENDFLPDLELIPADILQRAKMIVLNFPSNPTAALASSAFFEHLIEFATKHQILVVHDAAYIELVFDDLKAPSFLSFPGAKEIGIELHSFSKTYNFAGPRLAFAAGNRDILASLAKLKSQIDYGVFSAIQDAGAIALTHAHTFIENNRRHYQERRDAFMAPLEKAGSIVRKPPGTMFVWLKTPKNFDSRSFAKQLLVTTGIMSVPGIGFGTMGEGYIRLALVQPSEILSQAGELLANFY